MLTGHGVGICCSVADRAGGTRRRILLCVLSSFVAECGMMKGNKQHNPVE